MVKKKEIYKCDICGNVTEVLTPKDGTLVCCGQEMRLLKENMVEGVSEKHIPVIEKIEGGYKVQVGSVLHPMEEKHYIEWIELVGKEFSYRKFLKPTDKPTAIFKTDETEVFAREYCNLHELWKS